MARLLTLGHIAGNLGHAAGARSDGVLLGMLTKQNPAKAILEELAQACLAVACDYPAYVVETTAANEATADDITLLPATPAVNDAYYFGHGTKKFGQVDVLISTQGAGTWTIVHEYWNGSAWTALGGVYDGTAGFKAVTGTKSITFAIPTDWARCTVHGVLGYWMRARVSAYTNKTTQPLATQAWVVATRTRSSYVLLDDGGVYTDLTDEAGEDTANDVTLLPATPAVNDALLIGDAEYPFNSVAVVISTQGAGTWTCTLEYLAADGTWKALSGVTDGTTGFTAATGTRTITFSVPTDWGLQTVEGITAYWIRSRVSAYTSKTTQPLATRIAGTTITGPSTFTDDTTDFTDAGASDVNLLGAHPIVNDGFYVGDGEQFFKVLVTTSQARTGTATLGLEYWNGAEWKTLTGTDGSTGWSATAGPLVISFAPPTDWVANTTANGPNGEAGYFIRMRASAITSVTQQPQATQGWILQTGPTYGTGITVPFSCQISKLQFNALTASGSSNDTVLLLLNLTQGRSVTVTWTKATACLLASASLNVNADDELALVMVRGDGSTEYANANVHAHTN